MFLRICLAAWMMGAGLADGASSTVLTGKLTLRNGKAPALELAGRKLVELDGDADTRGVLNDQRLAGLEMELRGQVTSPGKFLVDPIHTRAMHVHKSGKKLVITYWCDVCSIRTYTPSKCWCCQQETELDLRPPDQLNEEK